jgi:HTH-type transcriptional regulator, transcriptional repressor of NAD biosynthesis genes
VAVRLAGAAVTRGLVLGKFAPLHAGHQLLIETALAQVDELVVLVYPAPDVTWIPLERRADWIRALYPRARVVEGHRGPTSTGRAPAVMREQEDYILRTVPRPITHFFSSEWYGEHVSRALGAVDVRVDPERRRVPVSGTLVRADPFVHRRLLPPVVYRDLVRKVAFLGAESTGKTTLAALVAEEHGTRALLEPGRAFWERHRDADGRLTPDQLVSLAHLHLEREDAELLEARGVLFVDTNALTTEAYAFRYHGHAHPELTRLARQAETRYDVTFVCGDEIPFVQDGTRLDESARGEMQRRLCDELDRRGVLWTRVEGPLALRTLRVGRVLASLWPRGPSDHFQLA